MRWGEHDGSRAVVSFHCVARQYPFCRLRRTRTGKKSSFVLKRAAASTRTPQVPAPLIFCGWAVALTSLSLHLRMSMGALSRCAPIRSLPHPSMIQSQTNQPPLLREALDPLGLDARGPLAIFRDKGRQRPVLWSSSLGAPHRGGDVTEKNDSYYGLWLSLFSA